MDSLPQEVPLSFFFDSRSFFSLNSLSSDDILDMKKMNDRLLGSIGETPRAEDAPWSLVRCEAKRFSFHRL